ncbi:phage tail sheath C-terminal domain-containing protein [uncultured Phenylobacterium sp.]|uniref:phage tail sheath family protein n=1 Tax=uncultured Phenylobacterium sp. TaxID=349273 RepID=UPI0025D5D351|nr:phage tail sheath C-terminal domain-containing protein [uncultured Phenylobacterium sp.]
MATYKTPGVYVEEQSAFPNSVMGVETSVAAFVGYTETASNDGTPLAGQAFRISSMTEFERFFGGPPRPRVRVEAPDRVTALGPPFRLHTAMLQFFQSGGGACWIVSVGGYEGRAIDRAALAGGLTALEAEREPALLVIPDAVGLAVAADCYALQREMLAHCGAIMRSRFAILDVYDGDRPRDDPRGDVVAAFRDGIGPEHLGWGAAYYPWVHANAVAPGDLAQADFEGVDLPLISSVEAAHLRTAAARMLNLMPPSAAIAGIYASVDGARGVWKAPANVGLPGVFETAVAIDQAQGDDLNVTVTGKSVNAIRTFPGQGVLVWGARTLDGNSQDWRYVPVRRTLIMLEESCRLAMQAMVFEPNVTRTWVIVRGMIENFLVNIWKQGALAGTKPEEAFFVRCGLGDTMTQGDVDGGVLWVTIGVAVARPEEFIVVSIAQTMQAG